jgi:hypothetical protein
MEGRVKESIAIFVVTVFVGLIAIRIGIAQSEEDAPTQVGQSPQAPYTRQYEGHVTVRPDRTATEVVTQRIKLLTSNAVAALSQQQLFFVEGMQSLETLEAFTEKTDGTRVPVDPANMISQDAASALPATYRRNLKQRTVIFQDVQVGDTLVTKYAMEYRQGLFPGHFVYHNVFPRSLAYSSAQVIVDAPKDLKLQVKAIGAGLTDLVEDPNGIHRHTVTLVPQAYWPDEAGAVAWVDRDPILLVSTFRSYEEMGLAYAATAFPKAIVTPRIAALADDITRNIEDKKQQAIAIDGWVKKNIRYVEVHLASHLGPSDATAVLKNKFGDCKDHTTLMSALLAAKGIVSESVLINAGPSYTLPEPPTMASLNHVILYLPEFDLYDDPTASFAAFGVLAPQTYDKPVVRVGATGATLSRTPAMKPEDHTRHTRTIINVAMDGKVSGQTEESNTGIFGMNLRTIGVAVQNLGQSAAAQRFLQNLNTPGTGGFDMGNSAEKADPVTVRGWFTLSERFEPPTVSARAQIAFGMPLTGRPGSMLLGNRLSGRKSAFTCYAGRQTEDIEVTFDQNLPMPIALRPSAIDNQAFTYRATFNVEGRTMKMHREFVSLVTGQVCSPELEAGIAAGMKAIATNVGTSYAFEGGRPSTHAGWGRFGVRIWKVTDEIADNLNIKPARGVLVLDIDENGPARRAGIERGDVILRFDGTEIKEPSDLPRLITATPVGRVVEIIVISNGKEETRTATLDR